MKTTFVLLATGKTLTQPELNLLAKIDKIGFKATEVQGERVNPYTGVKHTLEPLAASLFDFIIDTYKANMVGSVFPVQTWDRARYLFLKLWPDQYGDLID